MNAKVLTGAVVGAVVGAVIWGAITALTGYEVGYVAWGIGLLVGGLARAAGGSGQTTGLACVVLALASIFAGKLLAVKLAAPEWIREAAAEELDLTRDYYDVLMTDSEEFAKLQSEDDYPQFMVVSGYSEAENPDDVGTDEVDGFIRYQVPRLRRLYEDEPDYSTWRKQELDRVVEFSLKDFSLTEEVVSSLGLLDIVFAVLGLATAYKIGMADED